MRIIELNGEPGDDRAGRHLRHERPLLRRRHASERRRARHAGLPGRPADRVDGEHRALERRRRDGARARSRPTRPSSSRRGCASPASSSSPAGKPIESVMRIIEVNSRLPDFLRGDMWAGSPPRASASGGCSTSSSATASRPSSRRSTISWTTARRSRKRTLEELPKGTFTLEEEQDSGQVYRGHGRDHRRGVRRRPARQPGPGPRAEQRLPRRLARRRADGLHEPDRVARLGERRPLPAAEAADPPGLGLRPDAARGVRDLLRGRDPPLRPDLALPRAAPRRAPAGRELRLDLRHVHRRAASGHRAGTSRSSSRRSAAGAPRATSRRQPRDVQRLPRRHVQLPGRGRRGPLRAVRRPAGAERRARRRGRAPRRQGDRGRVPRPLERLLLHVRLHAQHPQAVAAGGRARGLAELRRGDPAPTARSSSSRSSPACR